MQMTGVDYRFTGGVPPGPPPVPAFTFVTMLEMVKLAYFVPGV